MLAGCATAIAIHVVIVIALLSERELEIPIPAEFKLANGRAAVARNLVVIVTFLTGIRHTITAKSQFTHCIKLTNRAECIRPPKSEISIIPNSTTIIGRIPENATNLVSGERCAESETTTEDQCRNTGNKGYGHRRAALVPISVYGDSTVDSAPWC